LTYTNKPNNLSFLLTDEVINLISRGMTHLVFRNGPVEDMHTNGQLSQEDMKTLNKYMVNNLATLFTAIKYERWYELGKMFSYLGLYGGDWDKAELDEQWCAELNIPNVSPV